MRREGGGRTGDGLGDEIPGKATASARQPEQEHGGSRERTQVPRSPSHQRTLVDHRPQESGADEGLRSSDHPPQSRRKLRADGGRTQLIPERMGDVLPPREVPIASERIGWLVSDETAMRAIETEETGRVDRGIPARFGRPEESFVDYGGLLERLEAHGSQPSGAGSHDTRLVPESATGMPDRQVCRATTLRETAEYDEYVRWCGRTGAARRPPTRFSISTRRASGVAIRAHFISDSSKKFSRMDRSCKNAHAEKKSHDLDALRAGRVDVRCGRAAAQLRPVLRNRGHGFTGAIAACGPFTGS